MPILTTPCSKEECSGTVSIDYTDYNIKEVVNDGTNLFEELECNQCGAKYRTVPWVALIDKDDELVTVI